MRSKNSKSFTQAEVAHLQAVKSVACSVCDAPPPSAAHHINQGQHFTCIALCWDCHQGPAGWHGTKTIWRIRKLDELSALNITLSRVNT
jgi:hypothetical protein